MIVREEKWSNIPLLHIVDETVEDSNIPAVIFLHGFTSAKEHNLHYAYNIAKKGFRVLLPEAHLHGVRDEGLDEVQLSLRFWEIVLTSIEEMGILHKELVERGVPKIGMGGTSMGGITTLGCMTAYPWIDTAVVMMGAPGYVELAKAQIAQFENRGFKLPISDEERKSLIDTLSLFDMTKQRQKLNRRPVFFWHGQQDTTVPFEPTYNFFKAAKKDYQDLPERFEFMADPTAGHAVSRSGMLRAADWFASYLNE
ncbi:prolyl oligopeptidase family serine peptidase [Sporosarcina highlanderae]|uniref:Prolyl oligopeptidase family serine peptidase n=1 Tax=Sporosarcina highlanderae TaxID=3035916 RepID=A0ABT8JPW3_9BACL|nr:prolyl oligopeptidase family serine peptidase [Sporosarcina highlanderae]MDN4606853.1 prolyl oligopeptidase family serine peptidase [Sporosarcina highlanderae]